MIDSNVLADWFKDIWKMNVDLNISINNLNRLNELRYEHEKRIKNHGFFFHHRYQLVFILIIQLSKLLSGSRNQKRSYIQLCRYILDKEPDRSLIKQIESNADNPSLRLCKSVAAFRDEANRSLNEIEKYRPSIDHIVKARDKVFAHQDSQPFVDEIKVSDLKLLTSLSADLYNNLYGKLFGSDTGFHITLEWDVDYVLRTMSEHVKNANEYYDGLIDGTQQ